MPEARALPYSPLMVAASSSSTIRPAPTARAEKNERRRLRPRSRSARVKIWIMATSHEVQGLGRLVPGGLIGRQERGQGGDDRHGQGARRQFFNAQRWIDAAGDERHVRGGAREGRKVKAN